MKKTDLPIENYILNGVIDVSEVDSGKKANSANQSVIKRSSELNPRNSKYTKSNFKGIGFITDFEGNFKYVNPLFLSENNILDTSFAKRNIIECIHQEDLPSGIEFLIKLIQGDTTFVTFQSRVSFVENVYINVTWNIACSGQLLFFTISSNDFFSGVTHQEKINKDTLDDQYFDTIYWKMEVSKSIKDWDQLVLPYLDSCTDLKKL